MKVLAVDSSQLRAAVALLELDEEGCRLLSGRAGSTAVAASESLLPLIHETLAAGGAGLSDIGAFAAGVGPGSFTGLRIGLATVKTLAQVLGRPVLPFSSLRALALSAAVPGDATLAAMANAYQQQVFVGWFDDSAWREDAMTAVDWARRHGAVSPGVFIVGSGGDAYEGPLKEALPGAHFVTGVVIEPQGLAGAVAEAAASLGGKALVDATAVAARYLRPSQADLNLAAARAKV